MKIIRYLLIVFITCFRRGGLMLRGKLRRCHNWGRGREVGALLAKTATSAWPSSSHRKHEKSQRSVGRNVLNHCKRLQRRRSSQAKPLRIRNVIVVCLVVCFPLLGQAQNAETSTYLGYAFPVGGQVGETFEVLLGGRYLNGAESVVVSGDGVEVKVLKHYRVLRNLNGGRKAILRMKMAQREFELSGKEIPPWVRKAYDKLTEAELKKDALPPSPVFDGIEMMDADQLKALKVYLEGFNTRQYNPQIAEQVMLEVTISKDAELGTREMRIVSKAGLSNPIRFQVSRMAEYSEREPNDAASAYSSTPLVKQIPAVINGQVMPGDVDRFLFHFEPGQHVCFDLMARRLVPYVADAVPGWFQSTLAIFDQNGTRLAYVDDTYGDPDPRLEYTFVNGGNYLVEVRDAIYRGRENFVYRLFVSSDPLQENTLRHADVDYEAKPLPLLQENEPNHSRLNADTVELPQMVVGCIDEPGDVDLYAFNGRAGETLIAKVEARYFDSPMDSLLRLISPRGEMLALNDDNVDKRNHLHLGPGLMTHYADSYLRYELPEDGRYLISVEDVQRSGGPDYQYRLRLSNPLPDFEARVSPSSINVGPTGYASLRFYVNRLDGFDGSIEFKLVNPPKGMRLNHAQVASGQNETWATLQWHGSKRLDMATLQIEAIAVQDDHETRRAVVPSDNSMQAFLWRHLLPAQELCALSLSNYKRLPLNSKEGVEVLHFSAGKLVDLVLPMTGPVKSADKIHFKLAEAPEGVELVSWKLEDAGLCLQFKCADEFDMDGASGNVIVEVFSRWENKKNKKSGQSSAGMLPAIPYQISKL